MFQTETKTITTSHERSFGHAVCDRCGHEMDEADHHSGYNNLTLLRFRAGFGSKFGEGSHIEGDFCDACLFELLSPYVRVIDDERIPDSDDFFRIQSPRRLYAEHQIAGAVADGLWMSVREWIDQCFDPTFTRRPVASKRTVPATTMQSKRQPNDGLRGHWPPPERKPELIHAPASAKRTARSPYLEEFSDVHH